MKCSQNTPHPTYTKIIGRNHAIFINSRLHSLMQRRTLIMKSKHSIGTVSSYPLPTATPPLPRHPRCVWEPDGGDNEKPKTYHPLNVTPKPASCNLISETIEAKVACERGSLSCYTFAFNVLYRSVVCAEKLRDPHTT